MHSLQASETFHKYVKRAKEQGRRFAYVPVVNDIVEDSEQDNAWICPRFVIEDALKRCIGKYGLKFC